MNTPTDSRTSPRAPTRHARPDTMSFARALLAHVCEQGSIKLEDAWKLASRDVTALELAHPTPPGGWMRLAGLVFDSHMLSIHHGTIRPRVTLQEFDTWSHERFARSMLATLTQRINPPPVVATLMMLLSVHPSWAMLLARCVKTGKSHESSERFPTEILEHVSVGVFATIALILRALARVEPGRSYPLEEMGEMILGSCLIGLSFIHEAGPSDTGIVPVRFDVGRSIDLDARAQQFALEFTRDFLVPAGAATLFEDDTFCVFPEAIPLDVGIHRYGDLGEVDWRELMMS